LPSHRTLWYNAASFGWGHAHMSDSAETSIQGLDSLDKWLIETIGTRGVPRIALFGAVKSGKTTYFRQLPNRQPHVQRGVEYKYWDLLSTPYPKDPETFWQQFQRIISPNNLVLPTNAECLNELLSSTGGEARRIVIALDGWDHARRYSESFIDLPALADLMDYVIAQDSHPPPRVLGLILITSFPTRDSLIKFAHREPTAGLLRISGLITRSFRAAAMPWLSSTDAHNLVASIVRNERVSERIAQDCGGWPGLLQDAARVYLSSRRSDWTESHRQTVVETHLPILLGQAILPLLKIDWEQGSYVEAWAEALRRIRTKRVRPSDLGLPPAFDDTQSTRVRLFWSDVTRASARSGEHGVLTA